MPAADDPSSSGNAGAVARNGLEDGDMVATIDVDPHFREFEAKSEYSAGFQLCAPPVSFRDEAIHSNSLLSTD